MVTAKLGQRPPSAPDLASLRSADARRRGEDFYVGPGGVVLHKQHLTSMTKRGVGLRADERTPAAPGVDAVFTELPPMFSQQPVLDASDGVSPNSIRDLRNPVPVIVAAQQARQTPQRRKTAATKKREPGPGGPKRSPGGSGRQR